MRKFFMLIALLAAIPAAGQTFRTYECYRTIDKIKVERVEA